MSSKDFSCNLYFRQEQWGQVMKTVTEHALPNPRLQTALDLPSGECLLVPFKRREHQKDQWSGAFTVFGVPLLFRNGEVPESVLKAIEQNPDFHPILIVVYFDLFVNNNLPFKQIEDSRLVKFHFLAGSTSVSEVLFDCSTVMEPFWDMLEKHQGLGGLFGKELDSYFEVFWLEGQRLNPPAQMDGERINKRLQAML